MGMAVVTLDTSMCTISIQLILPAQPWRIVMRVGTCMRTAD
jgi:hypothetical protein